LKTKEQHLEENQKRHPNHVLSPNKEEAKQTSAKDEKLFETTKRLPGSVYRIMTYFYLYLYLGFLLLTSISSIHMNRIVSTQNLPSFDFGSEISDLLSVGSQLEAENMFNIHMGSIRDFYLTQFMKQLSVTNLTIENCEIQKEWIVNGCKAALKDALPPKAPTNWDIEVSFFATTDVFFIMF
jgi:hypothetical protein